MNHTVFTQKATIPQLGKDKGNNGRSELIHLKVKLVAGNTAIHCRVPAVATTAIATRVANSRLGMLLASFLTTLRLAMSHRWRWHVWLRLRRALNNATRLAP